MHEDQEALAKLKILSIAPFDKWTYEDAAKAMRDILPANYNEVYEFAVDKDHYQDGDGWVGPGNAKVNEKIGEQFAPDDAIGEVLKNIENAFSEPQLGTSAVAETEGVKARADELKSLLADWWDKQRLHELVLDRQRTAAWAGWAGLRLWVPWRFLTQAEDGTVAIRETDDFKKALSYIHVMAPSPKHGAIITDPSTQDKIAVYLDEEVEYVGPKNEKKTYARAELMYLDPEREDDEDADTIVRIVYANRDKPDQVIRLQVGGRLLFGEMRATVVITDPVVRSQKQLNLLTTLVTRLAETAAFRERYTYNAKPQGLRIPYEDGDKLASGAFVERDDEGRQWAVIPQPRTLGAATTTELVGLAKFSKEGDQVGHETPGVEIVDPVDPAPYTTAADAVRRRVLRMCSQGHLGGVSNAEASGIAYEQARAVFAKDLNKRRVSEEGMLRDAIEAFLCQPSYTLCSFTDAIQALEAL